MVLFGSERRKKYRSSPSDQQIPRYSVFPTKFEDPILEGAALTSLKCEGKASPETPSPSPTRRREKWTDSFKSKAKYLMMASKDAKEEECTLRSSPIPIPSPHFASGPAPAVSVSIPHSRLSSGSLEDFLSADRHVSNYRPELELVSLPALATVRGDHLFKETVHRFTMCLGEV
jgi:hypothetical protein